MRREGQRRIGRHALAQAEGGAREAPGPEGALMQPLDRGRIGGKLMANGQGKRSHDGGKPADGQRLGK